MVPEFVLSLADGPLLLLLVLFYSLFDLCWPAKTSEVHFGYLLRNKQLADSAKICS